MRDVQARPPEDETLTGCPCVDQAETRHSGALEAMSELETRWRVSIHMWLSDVFGLASQSAKKKRSAPRGSGRAGRPTCLEQAAQTISLGGGGVG
jgi:hypothetical protein